MIGYRKQETSVHEFLAKKQTIRCNHCAACFSLDQKDSFELFKWRCPECHEGRCEVVDLADDFRSEVENLEQEAVLEPVELDILNALYEEGSKMRAGEISSLIDVTYQLVGRRTSKLSDMGLVEKSRSSNDNKVRSKITDRAKANYFKD